MEHGRKHHAVSPTFAIICGMNGCLRKFKNFLSFRTHMYQWHGGDPNVPKNSAVFVVPSNQSPTEELVNISSNIAGEVYEKDILSFSFNGEQKNFFTFSCINY